ncbi:hypothetical protein [Nocardia sp. NPDC019395]|uniref:hypothetical protein n=1 Tax=Nocardia sp. NPDC019395 TaxID=3154686 RepID=UPI003410D475
MKDGNLLLVGRDVPGAEIVAAVHLMLDCSVPGLFVAHIAAIGVSNAVRGRGGDVADTTLGEVRRRIVERAVSLGRGVAVASASIHRQNRPSELLFERAGFEPRSAPVGDYQEWACRIL